MSEYAVFRRTSEALKEPKGDHSVSPRALQASHRSAMAGFTVIELMIVVLIAAILLMVAIPSFDSVIKRNRIESLQSQLSSALATARTEATSRNAVVSICAGDGGESCTTAAGDWSNGWVVFVDDDMDGVRDDGEFVIDTFKHDSNYHMNAVSGIANTASNFITYGYRGFLRNVQPTLVTICEPDKEVGYARGLFVSASGAVLKTRDGADAGDVHDHPLIADANLTCI